MEGLELKIFNAGKLFSDLLFPRYCCSCGQPLLPEEKFLCSSCVSKLERTTDAVLKSEFERKFLAEGYISDFYAPLYFIKDTPIQDLIHELKYRKKFGVGAFLGELIGLEARNKILSWKADLISPIPLHILKKASRSYNQSFYLAKGVAKVIPVKIKRTLKRKKFTTSQTTLTHEERQANVSGAFRLRRFSNVAEKKIILIDDVITTGSTISEAAKVLKENGAKDVFALSVCLTQLPSRENQD